MNFQSVSLQPALYLVGVPIGTARDITLRALDILASADVLAAEDTRSLRKLMEIHGVPLAGRKIFSLHDHSGDQVQNALVGAIEKGQSVAYASEAGMPLIADPGFELVKAARAAQLPVTSAPGPSAVTTALSIAGLATDSFHFAGFLPSSATARRKALASLSNLQSTLVLFESPKRLPACLRDAAEVLGAERTAAICRELTKKFEEVRQGSLGELALHAAEKRLKGEIVLLIDRDKTDIVVSEELLDGMIRQELELGSVRDAADNIASKTGLKRRVVYQRALELSKS